MLVTTEVLSNIIRSQQNVRHSKHTIVMTKDMFYPDKRVFKHVFVATNVCLSQQKRHKSFVATKTMLVAAPANDSPEP